MLTRLRRRLHRAAQEKRGILLGFLPAGYPTRERFTAAVGAAFDAGLDAMEVSMPGPAPALDGERIQQAATVASAQVRDVHDALALAAAGRREADDTIIAMAYAELFERISAEQFLDALVAADIDAFLLPQATVAEQLELALRARPRGIEAFIFLHLQEDLDRLAASELEEPVIYLQSADLRTGGAFNPDKAAERLTELADAMGDKRYFVAVGFGVRGFDEAALLMAAGADGIIIGTRLVAAAEAGPEEVALLVDEVAPALVRREELRS
ncbi:tryptophan synthase subunit alpha [Tessaracoccus sp. OS52]|uniref:tryptophan synthase subunit alpha n=1 Tax=Tessaracoccus sp. OS52 TaxID=2886691 RepID=UPI001D11BB79|nr:tryptophan synthase subunit alpha [Tessaracoccus sp. OS52]MCC2592927.1 tryptophan synthase subunit alpha [Tessaracoccus sp. OS52]